METKVKNNSNAIDNNKSDKKAAFVNNNPVNKENTPVAQSEAEKPNAEAEAVKADEQKLTIEAPNAEAVKMEVPKGEAPQTESFRLEAKPEPKKPALNLEETLKLVAELNRRKIQRDKLIETIDNLEAFEVDMKEDADETDGNIYQGCTLTIEDDNRRKFVTKNPVIIFTVAQQVNRMCVDKLSEIEAGIILPA